ncbi:hypothetical protein KBZ12_09045 [Cyanobium sp. Cruz CV13-4-11]|uniref:hypothetical protein n=1 Tax=unclassified Cyanobium TaxID=2627006 RepID=UPI0020CFC0A8|nr:MULTISPECIES: hypothetical protein [unclassified Cyanobium]MCP9900655.1 hypothetical protein [Cyanobium sp. Cruz CV11-17]MCP9919626.1 hypothetical protein [Cyanobium sp. Cruz CV13-4-11]
MSSLVPLELWVRPAPGPRLPQLRQALVKEARRLAGEGAEPLRWAITAVDPVRGLRLEGIVVGPAPVPGP